MNRTAAACNRPAPRAAPMAGSHIACLPARRHLRSVLTAASMKLLALALLGCLALASAAGDDPTVSLPGVTDLSECGASDRAAH